MKAPVFLIRTISVLTIFFCATLAALSQNNVVISQVYGGGGNSGATYLYDYIELYNPTSSAVDLSSYSIQYASSTGSNWNVTNLTGTIQPGHYFLIRGCTGNNSSTAPDLPVTSDFDYPNYNNSSTCNGNLSASAGKVALVSNQTAMTGTATSPATPLTGTSCPANNTAAIVDFVGYGTATCHEGATAAPTISATTADSRGNPTSETNINGTDFTAGPLNPHNSSSTYTPPVTIAIHTLQGQKSLTASTISPYAGQQIITTGVVTAVLSNGFFIQTPDAQADSDPLTPEGVDVYTGSAPTVTVGNYVQVAGTVSTYPAATASHTPATEIISPTVTYPNGTGLVALPTPITLTASMLTPSGGLYQLTPYEGMRVSVPSMTTVSGTNGSITSTNEPNELATSTGYFYAVITGTARPFREAGIDIRDPLVPGTPANVAHFDDNPERILVDSTLAGGTSLEISTGAVLPNVTGVLDFTFSNDTYYDPSRLILDATYDRTQVTPGITVQPVPLPAANEFTVASFNIERFYNTSSSDDLYYVPAGVNGYNGSSSTPTVSNGQTFQSQAVDITNAAYNRRLAKVSLAIRNVLNNPDIVTLEEVENQNVANDIANQINTDAGVPNLYTAYSTDNSTFYSQDGTGISVGFLVKNTVNKLGFTQFGQNETFTPTGATNPITLNDRPWLVLNAGIKRTGATDYPVTVIVNHMKALTGENSTTSNSTRQKKELQAEDIAKYIQTLQAAGQHVISGGDFNAFEFSDGYADTLATYTNVNVLPPDQVLLPGVAGLVTPPLTDLTLTLPVNERESYVEDGNAQVLDHMVVTSDLANAGAHIVYAHIDADFPLTAYNDATTPARTSDHDPVVGYFALPAATTAVSLNPTSGTFGSVNLGSSSTGQVFTFSNTGETDVTISSVAATGDYAVTGNCVGTLAAGSSCTATVVFTPTAAGTRSGSLNITTTLPNPVFTAALTGTGVAPGLPTLSPSALTFGNTVVGASSTAQTVTVTNPAAVPVSIGSVAVTGDYTQTNTCGTSIAANSTCTVSVVFKPTATGTRAGTLTVVSTGAAATTLTASLTGTGVVSDFTVGGTTTTSVTVAAGQTGTVSLTFTPVNSFNGTITLTCAASGTAPTGVSCTPPAAFTLGASATTQTVSFTTTARTTSSGLAFGSTGSRTTTLLLLSLSGILMLLATRARSLGRSSLQRITRVGGLLALVLALLIPAVGCSGSSSNNGNGTGTNVNGTPAGTYTYNVTATGAGQTHTQAVTLVVQ